MSMIMAPSQSKKARIVVVDDEPEVLELLTLMLLHSGNDVLPFTSGKAALEFLAGEPPDIILLDATMPGMDGFQLCERVKQNPSLKEVPVIFLSALLTTDDKMRGFRAGGVDYITKPYQFDEVQARVNTHIRLARADALLRLQNEKLEQTILERTADLQTDIEARKLVEARLALQVAATEEAFNYTVFALARAAEANDEDTGNHIIRVGEFSAIIASQLGMDDDFVRTIHVQAILHDVGKIHIPPEILKKGGQLTAEEFAKMKEHSVAGTMIIGNSLKLGVGRSIALTHHEKWDGSGYPHGLKGNQIPVEGRITALADIYDALRSPRSYKDAFDHEKAFKIITQGDGRTAPGHFAPAVLQAFKETADQFEAVYENLKG